MRGHPFRLPAGHIPPQRRFSLVSPKMPHVKLDWMLRKMSHFEEKAEELYILGLVHRRMNLSVVSPA
jgi:hypothetical protein